MSFTVLKVRNQNDSGTHTFGFTDCAKSSEIWPSFAILTISFKQPPAALPQANMCRLYSSVACAQYDANSETGGWSTISTSRSRVADAYRWSMARTCWMDHQWCHNSRRTRDDMKMANQLGSQSGDKIYM